MAIDFMVMPLSRYLSGDFVTPIMQAAWDSGTPYNIVGPQGVRQLPPHLPFGGEGAEAHRVSLIPMLEEDLRALPVGTVDPMWNEHGDTEMYFHRVDAESYGALVEEAGSPKKNSWFGLRRVNTSQHHLRAIRHGDAV